jgi:predicted enzyme related to lactoylglutathione lyase
MDYRLEVVTLPVSDVDQACGFYAQAGFALDVDYHPASHFRVVQLTPPGSACSVQIGAGLTDAAPGSARATYLAVTDIEAAHRELTERGVKVSDIRHKSRSTAGPAPGSRVPTRSTATTPAWPTSPTQTATPGSSRSSATASRTPPAVSPGRCDDRFDQVTRRYTDGTVAVSGLSLKAATGAITGWWPRPDAANDKRCGWSTGRATRVGAGLGRRPGHRHDQAKRAAPQYQRRDPATA